MAVEPPESDYDPEWRLGFEAVNPGGPHVVFSGSARFAQDQSTLLLGTDDDVYTDYDVHLVVGPYFQNVVSVVPYVTILSYDNEDSDDDDEQGWRIEGLQWDAVSGTGPYVNEERIRLKFKLSLKGENTSIYRIGYYVTARGRNLGHDGLKSKPEPWPNP